MLMLMGPMVAQVPMLVIAGLCMGMAMRMLMYMPVGMAFTGIMCVSMTMFVFVLMRTFHRWYPPLASR
ncbi:MAG: hypothetical protein A4E19_04955 [Nitrospira sp. SG-bin1]|nr:MAG: hypothetical protein A4E19_04955 [Nitrospira sp. SG-bin1]